MATTKKATKKSELRDPDIYGLEIAANKALQKLPPPENVTFAIIKTPEAFIDVGNVLLRIKKAINAIEEDRKLIVGPIRSGLDRIYAKYRNALAPWLQAEEAAKAVLAEYGLREQAKALTKAEKEATALRERGASELANDRITAAADAKHTPDVPGVRLTGKWGFRVTSVEKLPMEFLIPDEKVIQKMVDGLGERAVGRWPGIEVFRTYTVAASHG